MAVKSFSVVGAGMGGLATALRLSHRGHSVSVYEKTDLVGGRNRPVPVNECRFDGGPTLMMMREPFDRLFADVGEVIDAHLSIQKLDPSYRVFYRDGLRLDATPNCGVMSNLIAEMFGKKDAQGFDNLLTDLKSMYEVAIPQFVRRNYNGPQDVLRPQSLAMVLRHGMLKNYARGISSYVSDPRLRMLLSFQTMYLGLSPYEAPWVYAVLTYMEYGEGIWYPKGGLVQLASVIAKLAEDRGAKIFLNAPVQGVEDGRLTLQSGEIVDSDAVVINADLPYAQRVLLSDPPKAKKRRYSCSALSCFIDYKGQLPDLLHHNVFFGGDFRRNLEQVFNLRELPDDPSFYVSISARSDAECAPPGHENLFVLIPCPNLDRPWEEGDTQELSERAFNRLEQETNFKRSSIQAVRFYGPTDYQDELNLERGAAFGLSHHFGQSAFLRPSNRSKSNKKVYFVGASTVPGNGLPMVLISAELAEERIVKELGLAL